MLDVRRLRVLEVIGRRRSFSAAADELGYTQSAVSHQLATLEREVGLTLVERGVRPVALTPAGEALAERAAQALAIVRQAEEELEELSGRRSGRLRVAAAPSACVSVIPAAFTAFRRTHPGVKVELQEAGPGQALSLLRRGEVDLGVILTLPGQPIAPDPSLRIELLLEDEMVLIVPADHPLAARRSVSLGTIRDETWIAPTDPRREYDAVLRAVCAPAGFVPDIDIATNDTRTCQALVGAGLGVSLLPSLALRPLRDDVRVVKVRDGATRRDLVIATRAGRHVPAIEPMSSALVDAARRWREG